MAKLYDTNENSKNRVKRKKARNKRFYSQLDMSIVKHDEAVHNAQVKRGEVQGGNNGLIYECGCGAVGCFLHRSYSSKNPNEKGVELLRKIMNETKAKTSHKKDEENELAIKRAGFDTKTSFRG